MSREESIRELISRIDTFLWSPESTQKVEDFRITHTSISIKRICNYFVKTLNSIKTTLPSSIVFDYDLMEVLAAELDTLLKNHEPYTGNSIGLLLSKAEDFLASIHEGIRSFEHFLINNLYLDDNDAKFYFEAELGGITKKFTFVLNEATGKCSDCPFSEFNHDLKKFKMIVKVSDRNMVMFPDDKMKITRKIERNTVKYSLNVYSRDICDIKENTIDTKYKIHFEPIGNYLLMRKFCL